ncbi:MAG: type II secretion system GspH family protein [Puniceicoccales bacterium]|nr:type II secretion system GspH family protein [Puniceicoccales bacterium]
MRKIFKYQRAFTLLEVLVTIALIATLSGISLRLLGHESIFKASVKTFHAYLQSVSDYVGGHKKCYLLVGNSSLADEFLREFILVEVDANKGPLFLREYFFRLGHGEFLVPPKTSAADCDFQTNNTRPKTSGRWTPIAIGRGAGLIQFTLVFQSSRRTSCAIFRIEENGAVTLE